MGERKMLFPTMQSGISMSATLSSSLAWHAPSRPPKRLHSASAAFASSGGFWNPSGFRRQSKGNYEWTIELVN
jgi:hypothetical protein